MNDEALMAVLLPAPSALLATRKGRKTPITSRIGASRQLPWLWKAIPETRWDQVESLSRSGFLIEHGLRASALPLLPKAKQLNTFPHHALDGRHRVADL